MKQITKPHEPSREELVVKLTGQFKELGYNSDQIAMLFAFIDAADGRLKKYPQKS